MEKPKPFVGKLSELERALSRLEGWAFGPALHFSAMGYTEQLQISNVKDGEVQGFAHLPGLADFAADLNAVMKPVIVAYAARLRQEMANECARVAARALDK